MTIYTKGIVGAMSAVEGAIIVSITSTEEETKKVNSLVYWDVGTGGVILDVWLEREKIAENIPLNAITGATPERLIPINVAIPMGQTLQIVSTNMTGATAASLSGMIEYEIV